jgi:cholesterol transport system auxiliary component
MRADVQASSRITRRGALLLAAALPGCVPRLPGQGPGPREYRLTPKSTFPEDLPRVSWALAIAEPLAERSLDTNRIAIIRDGLQVEYYADATWTDRAPAMVQILMVQSFLRSNAITSVGTDRDRLRPDILLRSALRAFQTQSQSGAPEIVRVGLDVTLLRMPRRESIAFTSLTGEAVPAARTLDSVIAAYDTALGTVLKDLVVQTLNAGEAVSPTE